MIALGSVADVVAAGAAVGTLAVAYVQLRRVVEANQSQADVARADLMLKIDQIFESPDMVQSRISIRTMRNECEVAAQRERLGASDDEVFKRSARLFSERLTQLYEAYRTAGANDPSDDRAGAQYAEYMRLPNWMETVGMLTRRRLLRENDVLDLYDAVFTGVLACFEQHILDRRDGPPLRNADFLANAMWLLERARKKRVSTRRDGQPPPAT